MSTQRLGLSTATIAIAGAASLALTLSACSLDDTQSGAARNAGAQSDSSSSSDGASDTSTTTPSESTQEDDVQPTPFTGTNVLEKEMGGQEAIDALGDKISVVADRVGKTPEELRELLLRDQSAHVTPGGFLVYRDGFGSDDN